jgi:hypothetical protein
MGSRDGTLFHDFRNMPVAQRVGYVLTDAGQNDIYQKAHSLKLSMPDRYGQGAKVY